MRKVYALVLITALVAICSFPTGASAEKICVNEGTAAISATHTSCNVAVQVLKRAAHHLQKGQTYFNVYYRGTWHCAYVSISGGRGVECRRNRAIATYAELL